MCTLIYNILLQVYCKANCQYVFSILHIHAHTPCTGHTNAVSRFVVIKTTFVVEQGKKYRKWASEYVEFMTGTPPSSMQNHADLPSRTRHLHSDPSPIRQLPKIDECRPRWYRPRKSGIEQERPVMCDTTVENERNVRHTHAYT